MSLTQTQISQLYVAIFNRASEGSGNAFWQTQSDMAAAATQMLATTDAQNYFGDSLDSDQAFIEHIYLNTLNKTIDDDPDGIDYWVGLLAEGVATRGEVVAGLVQAIESYAPDGNNYDPDDTATVRAYHQFANRVEISDYMADHVFDPPSDYAVSTVFDKDLPVTDDPDTVLSAKTQVDALAEGDGDPGDDEDPGDDDGGDDAVTVAVSPDTDVDILDAAQADYVFEIASGTYTRTITNFEAGDVLDFPDGNQPTVNNFDFSDGSVELMFVLPGAVTVIELTGLDPSEDMQLIGIQSFEDVFGEGTII